MSLTSLQQELLDISQSGFPLVERPYRELAQQLGCTEDACHEAFGALLAAQAVRRVGASFDSRKLGYTSALCAFAVDAARLDHVAAIVSACPNVTHNYGRADRYNLWFTVIAAGKEALTTIVDGLAYKAGVDDFLVLQSSRTFKIRVDFACRQNGERRAAPSASAEAAPPFNAQDPVDLAIVRWAQGDISQLGLAPFAAGAAAVSADAGRAVSEAELIDRLRQLKANRTIRRFGSMVRHQKIGFAFNSMTVWNVPEKAQEAAGTAFAQCDFVSHCYTRSPAATWPYTLYAMVHAQSEEELEEHVAQLKAAAQEACKGPVDYRALDTRREYKKVSMTYFTENEHD